MSTNKSFEFGIKTKINYLSDIMEIPYINGHTSIFDITTDWDVAKL